MLRDNERPAGAAQNVRALGRGLDDISHHFLSTPKQPHAEPAQVPRGAEPHPPRPVTRAGVAVLRPGGRLLKPQLTATLCECRNALEEGMEGITPGVEVGQDDEFDLVALDAAHRVTIIDLATQADDELLTRGMSHVDWVLRNRGLVQRLCQWRTIDAEAVPRLFLVAPRFSDRVRSAVRRIATPSVTCFTYREIELWGGTGIYVERLT